MSIRDLISEVLEISNPKATTNKAESLRAGHEDCQPLGDLVRSTRCIQAVMYIPTILN